ncbi:trifunctional serine/threonine-protein kinase/ATP-binding protein/sensor histidine kinase [Argonema galeatum]|uniref:trifunctional serine/threonine-protein kinase/ATP-binding protein/sensor histidine kinase n=1 Tax=Argonema galeatum TaxID=2942762 RepID=UPI002011FD7A|nr:ATP-binding sensor histidine kinase [Argonema galeatum]MCL1465134.1 AAA family ATPase [Argonema galeatum A003/A1]
MNNSEQNSNPHTTVQILDYQILETIYSGSRTLVYRAIRTNDQLPVVIKLLKNDYPTFSELVQFRNQYTIAKNLCQPGIIKTYSLRPYRNGYALVMEDFGGISLQEWALKGENTMSLREFLQIAIALCDALDILYRERIIHKDIKPSNILINPETKQVKLIDFSIASLLPRETQTLINPNVLEGTLAYISPEQTGRMNRGIDYRTDFYSLGVTFYELLTGALPFPAKDPMELVHCHIAKASPLVHEINSEISSTISKIVNKLMAKNAEDRYQTALGIKIDLENCLTQILEIGQIKYFEIARQDVSDRFIIPDQLYGRETEVSTLLQAFERASLGKTEMMLVAGFSGIGKTAVVNEVHKPIVRQRGYFIKGKFDQFQRNIPFSAFVQAFRDLMEQLLAESDAQIQQWKNKILSAVGENGQVIIGVIPELERILGQQPPAPELSGTAAQNRFNLLFQNFTQVFTSAEHPLVMFLDDLQWADSASLKLMQLLMADTSHLFLIGAYRDNEVNPAHPLMLTLSEIQKNQATINTITLAPLTQIKVNQLVADTLKCPASLAGNLSQLIYRKTKGNPFFATQFLKALHQENLIQFDFDSRCWQCDLAQVNQQVLTDDVVTFMALQLQKLPRSTQNVLKLAACIGNQFDLAILAIVSEQSEIETAAELWKALQEGLILPISDVYKFYQENNNNKLALENGNTTKQLARYKFLHDRVQQAAYSLIPDRQKQATHLKIGQLLRENLSEIEQEEKLFDIVEHLNKGIKLITEPREQEILAQLNLKAGGKARNSTAYAAARTYFQTGSELLQTNCWQSQYELTLNLHIAAAEASYLNSDFDGMEQIATIVLRSAQTILDKIKIYEIQIAAKVLQSNVLEAIAIGRKALEQLGVELPTEPDRANTSSILQSLTTQLEGRQIEDLSDLPLMTDPNAQAAMELMAMLFSPIIQGMPGLLPLLSSMMVNLSLRSGNTVASITGYGIHGMVLCAFLEDPSAGYAFGKLALSLLEKFNIQKIKSAVMSLFGCFIQHYRERLDATIPTLKAAYHAGIETGDFLHAGFALGGHSNGRFFSGEDLNSFIQDMADYSVALAQVKQESARVYVNLGKQAAENLIELVSQPHCLIGNAYNETLMLTKHQQDNDLTALAQAYIYKLLLAYYFGNYTDARNYIAQANLCLMAVSGSIFVPIFHFYAALTHLALFPTQPEREQAELLAVAATHQKILHQWAHHAPMNHLHKWYLVEAERYRVLGEKFAASECYDRAINLAKEHQFINEAALVNELTAKFYLQWNKQRIAQEYAIEAYYAYARWGAKAKVADLERHYPQLLAPILQQTRSPVSISETIFTLGTVTSTISATSSSSSLSDTLDLAAILKASHTISGEIELEKLLSSLLSIVIENAGADKCVLMLLRDNRLLIKGSITLGTEPVVLQRLPIEESHDIPLRLIYKVLHNRQTVVLLDASADLTLANDSYIMRQQPKSILCSPILYQGKLMGILYLENNLATGAFTHERVELLNLLCTQAAISLENARLYEQSQTYAQQLEESLNSLSVSNSRFHNLVDNVPGVVYQYRMSTDGVMSLSYISADCYSLLEITPEQAMSNSEFLNNIVHPDDIAMFQQSSVDAIQALSPWQWSGRIVTPSGIIKWIHGESRIQRFAEGSIVWDGLFFDISDRKRAELALQQKTQDLAQALTELQNAQLQIVQSEKMSALGNLVAGVAHEMNNPLGFISASLQQAKPTFNDIVEHLKLYQESLTNPTDEILAHAEEIDLDYSLEDLPKVIDAMSIACDRLRNISTSLRVFSRADRDYKVPFNIHEGIDSTILILKHRLKANHQRPAIEVITEYGNLPQIECFPGQLNQVFMNIMANAIDALDESNINRSFAEIKANPKRITIQTSLVNKQVKISIADNGQGMNEEVKQKIFDHLFTTKAVGKGTGLGLAIARHIVVEKHGGTIEVNSVLREGTEFTIFLPLKG